MNRENTPLLQSPQNDDQCKKNTSHDLALSVPVNLWVDGLKADLDARYMQALDWSAGIRSLLAGRVSDTLACGGHTAK